MLYRMRVVRPERAIVNVDIHCEHYWEAYNQCVESYPDARNVYLDTRPRVDLNQRYNGQIWQSMNPYGNL